MARTKPQSLIRGEAELSSSWFSNSWRLFNQGTELARLRRFPRLHTSAVQLVDGTEWTIVPDGFAVVRALDAHGQEVARVTRRSWWGRSWDLTGTGFAFELISHPVPRRWIIAVGGSQVAEIKGSLVSYNTVTIDAPLTIPTVAAVLAWHVIARPWEQAAAPRGLIPRTPVGDSAVVLANDVAQGL